MIPDSTITKSKRANDSALWRTRTIDGFGGYVSLYSDRNDMDQLSVRLRTFVLWPSWAPGSVDRGQLAEAGFYYTGEADEVRCYCCRESFAGWKDGDVPLDVHRRRSPTCHVVADLDRKHPSLRPPPPSFSNARVDEASVKLPADVQTDGPSGKSPAEDLVDVDLRQMNISSRSAPAPVTTTRESKPGKLTPQVGKRHRSLT